MALNRIKDPNNPFTSYDTFPWIFEQHKPQIDSTVVPNSILLSLGSGANGNSQIVCSLESAVGSIYYISDYITKDGGVLARILPCLDEAMKHTAKYPSTAEDTGTDFRKTLHMLQRFTNNVTTMEEHTTVEICASNIGFPVEIRTHIPLYVDVHARSRYLDYKNNVASEGLETESDCYSSDSSTTDTDSDFSITNSDFNSSIANNSEKSVHSGSETSHEIFETRKSKNSSTANNSTKKFSQGHRKDDYEKFFENAAMESAPIFSLGGHNTAIAMGILYEYRGGQLAHFGYIPWCCIVQIRPTADTSQTTKKFAARIEWGPNCPLAGKYDQILRTVLKVPSYIGKVPSLPLDFDYFGNESHRKQADKVGKFILHGFSPETHVDASWETALIYLHKLQNGSYLDIQLFEIIERTVQNLKPNKQRHKLYTEYRMRNATVWNKDQKNLYKQMKISETIKNDSKLDQQLTNLINDAYMGEFMVPSAIKKTSAFVTTLILDLYSQVLNAPAKIHQEIPATIIEEKSLEELELLAKKIIDLDDIQDNTESETSCDDDASCHDIEVQMADSNPEIIKSTPQEKEFQFNIPYPEGANNDQKLAFTAIMIALQNHSPLFLANVTLLGGLGTGKTWLMRQIVNTLKTYKNIKTQCMAPLGAAATQMQDGHTMHCLMKLWFTSSEAASLPKLSLKNLTELRERITADDVISFDEISSAEPTTLGQVSARCKELFNDPSNPACYLMGVPRWTLPYGGLPVICTGDHNQIISVSNQTVFSIYPPQNLFAIEAVSHFNSSLIIQLHQFVRTETDLAHCQLLEKFRDINVQYPITPAFIESARTITKEMVANDPTLLFSVVICTTRMQVSEFNHAAANIFSSYHNRPIIKWMSRTENILTPTQEDWLKTVSLHTAELFCFGAPRIVNTNDYHHLGIQKGSQGLDFSLTCNIETDPELDIPNTASTTWLNSHPLSVNVYFPQLLALQSHHFLQLPSEDFQSYYIRLKEIAKNHNIETLESDPLKLAKTLMKISQQNLSCSLCDDKIVLPFLQQKNKDEVDTLSLGTNAKLSLHRMKAVSGFATTQHKCLGLTIKQCIIALEYTGTKQWKDDGIYVAYSRTRDSSSMFKFPPMSKTSFDYLYSIKRNERIVKWSVQYLTNKKGQKFKLPD
ncbi:hypothetical protein HK100_006747, partial [Physocladia obscura]